MADIFVSYSSEDLERVKPLVAALEEKGWSVWWDRELVAGPSFDREIEKALDAARSVVVIWSNSSIESTWVRAEANDGLERGLLVPVLVDDIRPPLVFRSAQTAKMLDWPDQTGELETVIDGITELLGKPFADTEKEVEEQRPIAVLPFANMSNDPDNEYFSDGISEEILNVLVRTNTIPVIARTSSFKFRGEEYDAKEIGEQLGISHLLEGSVRKSGNRVRITAQLIDTSTGVHLWSDKYDRDMDDIFAVQDEIALKIVNHIGIALPTNLSTVKDTEPGEATPGVEAYELYLQARHLANSGNPFEVERAIPLYERSLELNQEFADAWVDLAKTYMSLAEVPLARRIPAEVYPIAAKALMKALEINPAHTQAMAHLGAVKIYNEYQWQEGLQLLQRSVALNPMDAQVQALYGNFLNLISHPDATSVFEKAYLLNPFDLEVVSRRATKLAFDFEAVSAISLMEAVLVQNQDRYDANCIGALFYGLSNRLDVARNYLARTREIVGADYPMVKVIEVILEVNMNNTLRAGELREELLEIARLVRVGLLSNVSSQWNDTQWEQVLDIALSQRHPELLMWLLVKPFLLSETAWTRFKEVTRLKQENISPRAETQLVIRSEEDKSQLLSEAMKIGVDELAAYVGVYEDPKMGMTITVVLQNDELTYFSPAGKLSLVPKSQHHFEVLELESLIRFTEQDGMITQLETHSGLGTFTWLKREQRAT